MVIYAFMQMFNKAHKYKTLTYPLNKSLKTKKIEKR